MLELDRDGVVERRITLQLRSRTPSLLQDCASLPALLGLTAESGFNRAERLGAVGFDPMGIAPMP
jgi:hypothetical protein